MVAPETPLMLGSYAIYETKREWIRVAEVVEIKRVKPWVETPLTVT